MPAVARVLLVEDDDAIRTAVVGALEDAGLVVRGLVDGGALEAELDTFRPDLVVLDWMLPGRPGSALVRVVRARTDAGVVMLTALDALADRVSAFGAGVDDYVVKPFAMAELVLRLQALLRRLGRLPSTVEVGDLVLDEGAGVVTRAGHPLDLTATERRLLAFLVAHRGRTASTTQILTQVWGYDDYADNLVQVHVSALRRKIEAHGPRLIHTVRGVGYVLRAA
ncbi:response regulator transcription factor [Pseudokineococcus basanitobsidens]|uniref:Response regulator transcription factor n=1 Tax=Pseudokineococcus basanitobsidens TaxID=1926649 RepID=A0ABU8RFL1_9ACTN